ncbi:PHP domain-containing protein [Allochromatium palmeri]|uniref:PHP domain-containing protein n=1 Tax=Allochromatium palmeri TaxID=231048 RepID=A0A6N8EBI3_9GAMM|nr:PHP domain-containing protein [Allochromatium palmeri]MTW19897.1 PHP domain-containing protein [Allochromatium palmeri]
MHPIPDLHTHSTASDGTLTPTALVARASAAGVRVLALTDHDNTDGLAEAGRAAENCGLTLIPGAEISVTWNTRTVHVVGLRLDPTHAGLQAGLSRLMEFRAWRAEEIGRRLAKHGIEDAYEGARALAKGRLIGRTHFARLLVQRRRAADTSAVFRHFLTRGKPGHVPGDWASLEEALGWIRAAGGEAVIAHPARYDLTRSRIQRLLGEFRELGGVGVEVVTGSHSRDEAFTFARHAREQRLRASAGSDYHGPENPWLELGRLPVLPEGCVPIWRDWPELADQAPRVACG